MRVDRNHPPFPGQAGHGPRPATLSARIVADVRDALLNGDLKAGDVLGTEGSLSKQFNVSRVAVRDALKRLEATGVIEIRAGAGGGARIAHGNVPLFADVLAVQLRLIRAESADILDAQRAIEMMTAELAAQRVTDADLTRMESLLDEAERLVLHVDEFTRASFAFHVAIADAAHNDVLKMQLLAMHYVAWPRHNPTFAPDVAEYVVNAHRKLYTAIAARDAVAARDLMSEHIEQIRARRIPEHTDSEVLVGCC